MARALGTVRGWVGIMVLSGCGWTVGMAPGAMAAPPVDIQRSGANAEIQALLGWWSDGTAAGNAGDFYDNRDRSHSLFQLGAYPQMQAVSYAKEELDQRIDYGLAADVRPLVIVGNSSTARAAEAGGSNSRVMYMSAALQDALYRQYRGNNLFIYPEHLDHDPGRNGVDGGWGDLFPANTPYLLTSQGSSGTDLPFVRAAVLTMAAFRPETKRVLVENRLLMPALQMLFRLCATNVGDVDRYLSPVAHPSVFQGDAVDVLRMVRKAHEMLAAEVLPLAEVRVVDEDRAVAARDFFDEPRRGEKLSDTPGAVNRIWRTSARTRRMVLSADASFDVHQKPLSFRWVVTRGSPERTTIRPLNERGSVVEVTFRWNGWEPVAGPGSIESTRQDLAVFVSNGTWWSAPAFVTWYANPRERRSYDAEGRWVDIGFAGGTPGVALSSISELVDWLAQDPPTPAGTAFLNLAGPEALAPVFAAAPDLRPFEAAVVAARQSLTDASARVAGIEAEIKAVNATVPVDTAQLALLEARKTEARAVETRASAALQTASSTARTANQPVVKRVTDLVLSWIRTPDLAGARQAVLAPALETASVQGLKELAAAQGKALVWGLRPGRLAWTFAPAVGSRFTTAELDLLAEFHVAFLRSVVLPAFLTVRFTPDFADGELFPAARWRDVARYAHDGPLLGWRRFTGGAVEEYSWDGLRVLSSDNLGRPLRTRDVTYRRQANIVSPVPALSTNTHAYDGPRDFRGRVLRPK